MHELRHVCGVSVEAGRVIGEPEVVLHSPAFKCKLGHIVTYGSQKSLTGPLFETPTLEYPAVNSIHDWLTRC